MIIRRNSQFAPRTNLPNAVNYPLDGRFAKPPKKGQSTTKQRLADVAAALIRIKRGNDPTYLDEVAENQVDLNLVRRCLDDVVVANGSIQLIWKDGINENAAKFAVRRLFPDADFDFGFSKGPDTRRVSANFWNDHSPSKATNATNARYRGSKK